MDGIDIIRLKKFKQSQFSCGSTLEIINKYAISTFQYVLLNILIFKLLNYFILSSSEIYMFQCKNKMSLITSNFVGWLIVHILIMK